MPRRCLVPGCSNVNGCVEGLGFFRLPSGRDNSGEINARKLKRRDMWLEAMSLKLDTLSKSDIEQARVCGIHFISGRASKVCNENDPDWVPSLHLPIMPQTQELPPVVHEPRRALSFGTENTNNDENVLNGHLQNQYYSYNVEAMKLEIVTLKQDLALKDEIIATLESRISKLQENEASLINQIITKNEELDRLNGVIKEDIQTIGTLKQQMNNFTFSKENLKEDESKCRYYTGLDFKVLEFVHDSVQSFIPITERNVLTTFQSLILTLMKLRKNFDFIELGYKFNIARNTASSYFYKVLHILFMRLRVYVYRPERDELRRNIPEEFQKAFHSKVAVIVDCFEVFIARASQLQAAAQTFSHYKHHNTIKFLIVFGKYKGAQAKVQGITPQGTISFISDAYGGRTSDNYIIQNSGFLEKLSPGDLILADRGFTVTEEVHLYLAEIKTPAFLKGQKQLSPRDVEETRKIAHLRIHVERLIRSVKGKYNILQNKLCFNLLNDNDCTAVVDKIVTVCAALVNLCPSVTADFDFCEDL